MDDTPTHRHRGTHTCGTCGRPATAMAEREATADEAAAHHAAMDDWRRTEGLPPLPPDVPYKQAPVMIAVFGCDEHASV